VNWLISKIDISNLNKNEVRLRGLLLVFRFKFFARAMTAADAQPREASKEGEACTSHANHQSNEAKTAFSLFSSLFILLNLAFIERTSSGSGSVEGSS